MQYKQSLIRLFFFLLPFGAKAQTTFLPPGSKEYMLLERLEIKAGTDSVLNFSKTHPFSRRQFIPHLERVDSIAALSPVDQYNLYTANAANLEWAHGNRDEYLSKKPVLKHFYKTKATLYEVNQKDFYLAVNPVFQFYAGKEKNYNENIFLNTRGVSLRGRIADKIGFAAYVTENQERDPLYVQQWVTERQAVPGQGFYKDFKTTAYDYFDARGYITFNVAKYVDVVFGFDKNFIGNGHRSLFLSDFSNSALFLKLNTRIWKFNYQNLFMELQNKHRDVPADVLIPKKYAAMHHLDLAVTKWLNVGVFEGIIFGRDRFEFSYLVPVIFYRSIEQNTGSVDNAVAGLDFKANVAHRFQFYGQLLLDEFKLAEIKAAQGWWGNKYGWQLGAKYIDAFNVRNLDLQIESNRVRPFTYSHRDSTANYTHYNQPLAHPLGASFQEWIGIARYQPAPKWMIRGELLFYTQGKDTGNVNAGSNIFLPTTPDYRGNRDYGFEVGGPLKNEVGYASLLLSYEFRPNLFFEGNAVYRNQSLAGSSANTFIFTAGIRWNMHRREFDF